MSGKEPRNRTSKNEDDKQCFMKEQQLQKQILDWLRLSGYIAIKYRSAGIYNKKTGKYIPMGTTGVSDILFWGKKAGAIEVKMKGNKPTTKQLEFIEQIKSKGYIAFVAYSLDEVIEKLNCPSLIK